jgi:hypothetical protein
MEDRDYIDIIRRRAMLEARQTGKDVRIGAGKIMAWCGVGLPTGIALLRAWHRYIGDDDDGPMVLRHSTALSLEKEEGEEASAV